MLRIGMGYSRIITLKKLDRLQQRITTILVTVGHYLWGEVQGAQTT